MTATIFYSEKQIKMWLAAGGCWVNVYPARGGGVNYGLPVLSIQNSEDSRTIAGFGNLNAVYRIRIRARSRSATHQRTPESHS